MLRPHHVYPKICMLIIYYTKVGYLKLLPNDFPSRSKTVWEIRRFLSFKLKVKTINFECCKKSILNQNFNS